MSKLSELIAELCPNGVKTIRLSELCDIKNGYTPSKSVYEYWNGDTTVPWFRMEDIRANGHILSDSIQHVTKDAAKNGKLFPKNSIILATTATIGEHALITADSLANQQFTYLTIREPLRQLMDAKFFYYYMYVVDEWCKKNVNVSGFASVNMDGLKKLEIPLPPLKIQQEIVKILDKFTELQAELQAELDLRLKQYEHYRDDLLSFDKLVTLGGVARRAKLLDIVDYEQPTKYLVETTEYDDSYAIPVLTAGKTFVLGYTNETDGIYNASTEDPVIIFDDFTTDSKWVDFPFKVKSSAMKMLKLNKSGRETALLRWIYLCMQRLHYVPADHSRHWISKYSNLEIPLPPLEVQKRLVNVLDNFESICADLDIGLPAEINLRQQQYEYYRDELLSFKLTNV